jgi:hypothetical protein
VYLGGQLLATVEAAETFGDGTCHCMFIDAPGETATVSQPFTMSGWATDGRASSGNGIQYIDVWAYPMPVDPNLRPPVYVGGLNHWDPRPDVGAGLGATRFTLTGYNIPVSNLSPGEYEIQ